MISGGGTTIANQQNVPFPQSLGGPRPFPLFDFAAGVVVPTQVDGDPNTYYFPPGITSGIFAVYLWASYTTPGGSPAANYNSSITVATHGCNFYDSLNDVPPANFGGGVIQFRNQQISAGSSTTTTADGSFFVQVFSNYARFDISGATGTYANPVFTNMTVIQLPQAFI